MEIKNMNCDYVQEKLSSFLDREECPDDLEGTLSHLYGCESCQSFFGSAAKLRALAGDDRIAYPPDLDESITKEAALRRRTNALNYRLNLPVYAASAAAVILFVVSFFFGFMMQEDVHQKQLDAILQAPPAQVVYGMPTQLVYPVSVRETKGGRR
jgi:predicted anti-sigma-YlaC factor YlaD